MCMRNDDRRVSVDRLLLVLLVRAHLMLMLRLRLGIVARGVVDVPGEQPFQEGLLFRG